MLDAAGSDYTDTSRNASISRTQMPISLSIPFTSIEHHCNPYCDCYSRTRTQSYIEYVFREFQISLRDRQILRLRLLEI